MKTLPKTLLIAAVIAFAFSHTQPGSEVWYGILKPTGALLFVVGFIVHVVSRLDAEQYEADNQLRESLIQRSKASRLRKGGSPHQPKEIFAS